MVDTEHMVPHVLELTRTEIQVYCHYYYYYYYYYYYILIMTIITIMIIIVIIVCSGADGSTNIVTHNNTNATHKTVTLAS